VTKLAVAVVSITPTKRRRFLWAAWWTAPPARHPFRKPDASNGGAATREEALCEAERVAGRTLVVAPPTWARAWNRVLRGMPPWASREPDEPGAARPRALDAQPAAEPDSIWSVLGLAPTATVAEIKLAYRRRALETHPDHGGDAAAFRAVQRAYERALRRRETAARRPARRAPPR
jgi:hypothetical protein